MDYVKRPKSSWPQRPVVALAVHQSVVHVLASVRPAPPFNLCVAAAISSHNASSVAPRLLLHPHIYRALSIFLLEFLRCISGEDKMRLNALYGKGTTPEKWVARSDSKGSLSYGEGGIGRQEEDGVSA